MNKPILKIYVVFLMAFITSPAFSQIEDPEQVDAFLLENRNLKMTYADFPNAMRIYKDSKSDKMKGILLESLGVGCIIAGGYIILKGALSKDETKSGPSYGLPDFSSLGQIIVVSFGFLVGLTGVSIIRSGGSRISIARIKRRGSAQQYIWDVEAQSLQNDVGSVSLGLNSNGVGLFFTF